LRHIFIIDRGVVLLQTLDFQVFQVDQDIDFKRILHMP
jgi:hypothetical protein